MSRNNLIKNVAILLDFVISVIASCVSNFAQKISNSLYIASAVILFIAVVCVVVDFVLAKKSK